MKKLKMKLKILKKLLLGKYQNYQINKKKVEKEMEEV